MSISSEGKMKSVALFFMFVASFLCIVCFGRSAEATRKLVSENAGRALSLLSSMAQDPDAVDCVRRACLEEPYHESGQRHQGLEACKLDHFRRIASVMDANGRGPRLRSYALDQDAPPPDALVCESVTGRAEPSEETELDLAFLRQQEEKLALLRSGYNPETGGTGANVQAGTVKAKAAGTEVAKPAAKKRTAYSALTGPDKSNVAHCAPDRFTVRESNDSSVKLYVDAGAAYDELVHSCLSKRYRTDAISVVEENYVEATIPACILSDGRIELDPTRYSEILSRKRKLVLHGEPNLEFHAQCQAKGGKPWVALQGRQVLWLAGKDAPRQTWPSQAQPSGQVAQPSAAVEPPAASVSAENVTGPKPADSGNLGASSIVSSAEREPDVSASVQPVSSEGDAGADTAQDVSDEEKGSAPSYPDESLPGGTPPPADTDSALRILPGPNPATGPPQRPADWSWTVQGVRRGSCLLRATSPPGGSPLSGLRSGAGPPIQSDVFRLNRFFLCDALYPFPSVTNLGLTGRF